MAELTPIIPEFDEGRCDQCGVCERICPYGALSFNKSKDSVPILNRDYCQGCGWCVGHRKPNAITCIHAEIGEVVWDGFGAIANWV